MPVFATARAFPVTAGLREPDAFVGAVARNGVHGGRVEPVWFWRLERADIGRELGGRGQVGVCDKFHNPGIDPL